MTLFIAHYISSTCFFFFLKEVLLILVLFYFNILLHYFTFPLVCVQHSGPEIKWVDGGKQLLKISTHLVSTVYTQVSYKANLIREPFRNYICLFYVYTIYEKVFKLSMLTPFLSLGLFSWSLSFTSDVKNRSWMEGIQNMSLLSPVIHFSLNFPVRWELIVV